MTARFVVAPKSSVVFKSRIFSCGDEVPGLSASQLKEHVRTGFMVQAGSPESVSHAGSLPACTTPPIPIGEGGTEGTQRPLDLSPTSEVPSDEEAEDAVKMASLWALDPDGLTNKDVDELNVLVAERDREIAPFETVAEAVALLSRDFTAPAGASA